MTLTFAQARQSIAPGCNKLHYHRLPEVTETRLNKKQSRQRGINSGAKEKPPSCRCGSPLACWVAEALHFPKPNRGKPGSKRSRGLAARHSPSHILSYGPSAFAA